MGLSLGLYVHVPFCATSCDFCAFYQKEPKREDVQRFIEGILCEQRRFYPDMGQADTVFWGGGTPGVLSTSNLERLGSGLLAVIAPHAEWTVELAPSTVNPAKLRILKSLGVNRISLGIQSLDAAWLKKLGRDHSVEQNLRAYEMIRAEGFRSVNIDLMFALPGQTMEEWLRDLYAVFALKPDHISTYCLTFEEDTALWSKLQAGTFRRSIEQEAAMYEQTWDAMTQAGFAQYEISNFAREGHQCIHNLNTWRMQSWVGLGPSAASQYCMRRTTNVADLNKWLNGVHAEHLAFDDVTPLDEAMLAADSLIFGLRMNAGVNLDALALRLGYIERERPWEKILPFLEAEGFLLREGSIVKLTPQGRMVADSVAGHILDAF